MQMEILLAQKVPQLLQSLVHAKQSDFTESSGSTLQTLNAILTTTTSGNLSFRSRQVWVTSDTAL